MMFAPRTALLNNVGAEGGRQNPHSMVHDEAKLAATGCGCQRIQCAQRENVQYLRKLLTAEGAV